MSTATAVVPEPIPTSRRSGLSSIKTMFGPKKRHTITQVPTAHDSALPSTPEGDSSTVRSHKGLLPHQPPNVTSLFANQKRSLEKAAEKERQEQAKQTFQLSTIDDRGVFHPPTPMEKSSRDHFIDHDADYFDMIINTPPERVKTFLSAEKTISPYMFSAPRSAKNKRHTISSFASPPSPWPATTRPDFVAASGCPSPSPGEEVVAVQVTVASQDSAALEEALSSSIHSLLGTPTQEVPDLIEDSGSESSSNEPSPSVSTNVSPRSSTSSLTKESVARQENVKRIRQQLFGEELPLPF